MIATTRFGFSARSRAGGATHAVELSGGMGAVDDLLAPDRTISIRQRFIGLDRARWRATPLDHPAAAMMDTDLS